MHVINSLIVAFSTYSRIPTPRVEWSDGNMKYAMCFFPLVGACVAGVVALWLWICDLLALGAMLKGAVGAAIPLLVTGGIHMDGFMDTCDALASRQSIQRRLEILKDSHVGAFAVMGCCWYTFVMAGLFSQATPAIALPLGACFVLSRALSAWAAVFYKSARPRGMLDGFSKTAQKRIVGISGGIYALISCCIWLITGGWLALICPTTAAICHMAFRKMAYKQFGGVTGDLVGWYLQVTEICLISVVVLGVKLL